MYRIQRGTKTKNAHDWKQKFILSYLFLVFQYSLLLAIVVEYSACSSI